MLFVRCKSGVGLVVVSSFVKNSFCPFNIHDVSVCCLVVYYSLSVVFQLFQESKKIL